MIGIPDEVLGEEVSAGVHLRPGFSVTEDELRDQVRAHLAGCKVPKKLWFSEEPCPATRPARFSSGSCATS